MGVPAHFFDLDHPFVWSVDDLLSPQACQAWLARQHEWLEGTVHSREGRKVRPHIRDNHVSVIRSDSAAVSLGKLVLPHVPEQICGQQLWGVGSALRIYRYTPGQHFSPHRDQKYRHEDLTSHLAVLIYLDEGCEGGATHFLEQGKRYAPKTGQAVFFQNMTLHAGEEVRSGIKHLLRADIMYG